MALAPQFATHRFGSPPAAHTLELFLDLVCPFSKKQLNGVKESLIPLIENGKIKDDLQIIIRQVPQPWHASSTLVHEAVLAVSKVASNGDISAYKDVKVIKPFQEFFFLLMDKQDDYFDEPVANESPNATRERLAKLAGTIDGVDESKVLEALKIGKGNAGTSVSADLKLQVKFHRLQGVHVTPTVFLDGLADPSISSSFTKEDWTKYLEEKVLPKGSKL